MRENPTDRSASTPLEERRGEDCKRSCQSSPSLHAARGLQPREPGGLKRLLEWIYQLSHGLQAHISCSPRRSDPGTHSCGP